jgi:hypothetical protein
VSGASETSARVLVDNLDMGSLADFLDGKGALRVLPGTHQITIINGTTLIFQENVYLGDAVSRTLNVK